MCVRERKGKQSGSRAKYDGKKERKRAGKGENLLLVKPWKRAKGSRDKRLECVDDAF